MPDEARAWCEVIPVTMNGGAPQTAWMDVQIRGPQDVMGAVSVFACCTGSSSRHAKGLNGLGALKIAKYFDVYRLFVLLASVMEVCATDSCVDTVEIVASRTQASGHE